MKKYNFNAGPSMLPREVIEKTGPLNSVLISMALVSL